MRKILGLLLTLGLGFGWPAWGVDGATDGSIVFEQTYAGSLWPTEIDVDGNPGELAVVWQGCGGGAFGNYSYSAMSEVTPEPVESGRCPEGWVEEGLTTAFAFTQRNVMDGELIYFEQDPSGDTFFCSDPVTGDSFGTIATRIAGGTGWADGATGHATFEHTGVRRVADSVGRSVFVATSGKISGRITPVSDLER